MIELEDRNFALIMFNQKMDRLVENFMAGKTKPELVTEYVKLVNLCRQVAVYDVDLAMELFLAAVFLGYQLGMSALKGW